MISSGENKHLPTIGENCHESFPLLTRDCALIDAIIHRERPRYRSLVKTYMPDYEVLRTAFLHGTTHITSSARAEKKVRKYHGD